MSNVCHTSQSSSYSLHTTYLELSWEKKRHLTVLKQTEQPVACLEQSFLLCCWRKKEWYGGGGWLINTEILGGGSSGCRSKATHSLHHPVTGFSQRTWDNLTIHTISCHILFSGGDFFFSPCRIILFFMSVYQNNMMSVTISCHTFRWKAVSL